MLAKKFRFPLKTAKNLNWSSVKSEYFVFKKRENKLDWSRFGVIISGKNLKGAVKRNKLKRIIFNYIRINRINLIPGKDFVLMALPKVSGAGKKEVEEDLYRKFK